MTSLDRRTVLRSAAWSAPAIVAVSAAPAFATASGSDLGAYSIAGTCGVLGVVPPGFLLTSSATMPLPVGTSVLVTAGGIANAGVWSVTGGTASVEVVSPTVRRITLTTALPAGATMTMRTTLSISMAFTLNAGTTIPPGYTATGAKSTANVTSTLVLCSAS